MNSEVIDVMMARVETRETELTLYRLELETMVKERTQELLETNERLESEILEREKGEETLRKSLNEKEILLQEIHHRVKNNLQIISSFLRLHSYSIKDSKYEEVFKDCSLRIQSMAMLYEKIYESSELDRLDFRKYLDDLAVGLLRSYGINNHQIDINIQSGNLILDINSLVPCSLIIQELVSNSLKHAFPNGRKGEINVSLLNKENPNDIELVVNDNGIGFPEGYDIRKTETIGMQIIIALVEKQLKGKIELSRKMPTELKIGFTMKVENNGKTKNINC